MPDQVTLDDVWKAFRETDRIMRERNAETDRKMREMFVESNQGLFVIVQSGETVRLANAPDFVPRSW